jgi:hypothetical protein
VNFTHEVEWTWKKWTEQNRTEQQRNSDNHFRFW